MPTKSLCKQCGAEGAIESRFIGAGLRCALCEDSLEELYMEDIDCDDLLESEEL